jgi:hypothetical protein
MFLIIKLVQFSPAEFATHISDQTNCNEVEAEECDAYEENQEEPVAMVEEDSPPSVGPDGMAAESYVLLIFRFRMVFKLQSSCTNIDQNFHIKYVSCMKGNSS